jgi:membrane fusion protein (multidrug efflux system)
MYVNFSISEQRLLQLERERGSALDQNTPTAKAFRIVLADGSIYPEPAKLNFVDPAVDQRTATLPVRLTVPNPKGLLRAGQFARVVVTAEKRDDALLVPQRAVQDLQGKSYLWLVGAENKAEQRDVVMGPRIGAEWLVQSGLKPGDVVIVDGVQKLKPGRAVKAEALPPQDSLTGAAVVQPAPDAGDAGKSRSDATPTPDSKPAESPAAKAGGAA